MGVPSVVNHRWDIRPQMDRPKPQTPRESSERSVAEAAVSGVWPAPATTNYQ
jgi:hypothetical protein